MVLAYRKLSSYASPSKKKEEERDPSPQSSSPRKEIYQPFPQDIQVKQPPLLQRSYYAPEDTVHQVRDARKKHSTLSRSHTATLLKRHRQSVSRLSSSRQRSDPQLEQSHSTLHHAGLHLGIVLSAHSSLEEKREKTLEEQRQKVRERQHQDFLKERADFSQRKTPSDQKHASLQHTLVGKGDYTEGTFSLELSPQVQALLGDPQDEEGQETAKREKQRSILSSLERDQDINQSSLTFEIDHLYNLFSLSLSGQIAQILAYQEAASQEFDLPFWASQGLPGYHQEESSSVSLHTLPSFLQERDLPAEQYSWKAAQILLREKGKIYQMILRGLWTVTQETLAGEGIRSLTLYKPLLYEEEKTPSLLRATEIQGKTRIHPYPLSSWTLSLKTALSFCLSQGKQRGNILSVEVPLSSLLSCGQGGLGVWGEVFLLAGQGHVALRSLDSFSSLTSSLQG